MRFGRRLHACRCAGEQAIIKMTAQLAQHDAGARLLNAKSQRCTRDALRFVHLDEDAEPLKIKFRHAPLYQNDMFSIQYTALTT